MICTVFPVISSSLRMLIKLDTKSPRVKGLCFHSSRSWILASLHSGIVQLWDYRMGILLDRFDEHDGPVRGVNFHSNQPLFVSGGDDYKIKVWNYKLKRCLFTLLGHLDYIRSVNFHNEQPWILSSSDDQTCRIWNWQSRACLTVLTGHNHYVMCAEFHPSQDLVASASLDQTVRVWDISGLRAKSAAGSGTSGGGLESRIGAATGQTDLFGSSDVHVLHILEGHDRGVNWVAWHGGGMPLLASAADDRQVKLWRMGDNRAWEVDACRGHYNNVNCVIFHPRQDILLSASEDHTVKLWDVHRRTTVQTFRRDERFWVLSAHPTQNLFAAGHDQGFIVFKLERERPAFALHQNVLYYVKERYLRRCSLGRDGKPEHDIPIICHRRQPGTSPSPKIGTPFHMSFNAAEKAILLCSNSNNMETAVYELFILPKGIDELTSNVNAEFLEGKRGSGVCAVWVARNRFAVLDAKTSQVHLKNLKNETSKTLTEIPQCEALFYAGIGKLLLRQHDKCLLYDIQQKLVLATVRVTRCRYAVWSQDGGRVVLLGKHSLTTCDKNLKVLASLKEVSRVKSAAWDENGVLLYTTNNHIKYCLPNGDQGTIRTLDVPVYLSAAYGETVHCLDRQAVPRSFRVDTSEYKFKLALVAHRYEEVLQMVRSSRLVGQSIIAYLRKNGYAEVALQFVKDDKTRFNLALESGSIEIGLESAKKLDDPDCWHRLTQLALRQGKHNIVEICYQRTKQFNKLSFLYFVTGNLDKLSKMLRISEVKKDVSGMYQNALMLGDVSERIRALRAAGQHSLAYLTAITHGLEEQAEEIAQLTGIDTEAVKSNPEAQLLKPPPPIQPLKENWPLLHVSKGIFQGLAEKESKGSLLASSMDSSLLDGVEVSTEGWGADGMGELGFEGEGEPKFSDDENETGEVADEGTGWAGDDDLNLPADFEIDPSLLKSQLSAEGMYIPPSPGTSQTEVWLNNSQLSGDHLMAGSFLTAARLLNEQIGCINLAPFKDVFIRHHSASHIAIPGLPGTPPIRAYPHRNCREAGARGGLPTRLSNVDDLLAKLQVAYKLTTAGKFQEAVVKFKNVILQIPLLCVDSKKEIQIAEEMVGICREYIIGLSLELYRQTLPKDTPRNCELAAYFTHCDLLPVHQMLTLRTAAAISFKQRNLKMANSFARRLLELGPKADMATNAKKIIHAAGNDPKDENPVNYDEHNPFKICAATYQPIYRGKPHVVCPFTQAFYVPDKLGSIDAIAGISEVGKKCVGMKISPLQIR